MDLFLADMNASPWAECLLIWALAQFLGLALPPLRWLFGCAWPLALIWRISQRYRRLAGFTVSPSATSTSYSTSHSRSYSTSYSRSNPTSNTTSHSTSYSASHSRSHSTSNPTSYSRSHSPSVSNSTSNALSHSAQPSHTALPISDLVHPPSPIAGTSSASLLQPCCPVESPLHLSADLLYIASEWSVSPSGVGSPLLDRLLAVLSGPFTSLDSTSVGCCDTHIKATPFPPIIQRLIWWRLRRTFASDQQHFLSQRSNFTSFIHSAFETVLRLILHWLQDPDLVALKQDWHRRYGEEFHEANCDKYLRLSWHRLESALAPNNQSSLSNILVRESFCVKIIHPLLSTVTDPFWFNRMLIGYCTEKAIVQTLALAFQSIMESHLIEFPPQEFFSINAWESQRIPNIASRNRYAESLLKHVKRCRTLLDARCVRQTIRAEVSRMQRSRSANPATPDIIDKYIEQLYLVQEKYEARIDVLTEYFVVSSNDFRNIDAVDHNDTQESLSSPSSPCSNPVEQMLHAYLENRSDGLFYFLRFLESRQAEAKVQFWLKVENIRKETERSDLRQVVQDLYDQFFVSKSVLIDPIHPITLLSLKQFLQGMTSSADCVFTAQTEILRNLETVEYPAFKASPIFLQFLISTDKRHYNQDDHNSSIAEQFAGLPDPSILLDHPKSDVFTALRRSLRSLLQENLAPRFCELMNYSSKSFCTVMVGLGIRQLLSHDWDNGLLSVREILQSVQRISAIHAERRRHHDLDRSIPDTINSLSIQLEIIETFLDQRVMMNLLFSLVGDANREKEKIKTAEIRVRQILESCKSFVQDRLRNVTEARLAGDRFDGFTSWPEGNWRVNINRSGQTPKEVVYFITVVNQTEATGVVQSWVVPRRWTEFVKLYQSVSKQYPETSSFAFDLFSTKNVKLGHRTDDRNHDVKLNLFLQRLVNHSAIRNHVVLKEFLLQNSSHSNTRGCETSSRRSRLNELLDDVSESHTPSGSCVNVKPLFSESQSLSKKEKNTILADRKFDKSRMSAACPGNIDEFPDQLPLSGYITELFAIVFGLKNDDLIKESTTFLLINNFLATDIASGHQLDAFLNTLVQESMNSSLWLDLGNELLNLTDFPSGCRANRQRKDPANFQELDTLLSQLISLIIPEPLSSIIGQGKTVSSLVRCFSQLQSTATNKLIVLSLLDQLSGLVSQSLSCQ